MYVCVYIIYLETSREGREVPPPSPPLPPPLSLTVWLSFSSGTASPSSDEAASA